MFIVVFGNSNFTCTYSSKVGQKNLGVYFRSINFEHLTSTEQNRTKTWLMLLTKTLFKPKGLKQRFQSNTEQSGTTFSDQEAPKDGCVNRVLVLEVLQ